MKSKWVVALLAGVLAQVLLFAASAQATPTRVTQGEAQAIFQASETGGWSVVLNGGTVEEGAPADFLPDSIARISPSNPLWNGRHFCSLDWHVISVAAIEGNAAGGSRPNTEIFEVLSRATLLFTLDGTPLDTTRTAIKRMTNPGLRGLVEAFYVNTGRVLAPEDLSVGQHSLQALGSRPGRPPALLGPITFFIDAPETGTCL